MNRYLFVGIACLALFAISPAAAAGVGPDPGDAINSTVNQTSDATDSRFTLRQDTVTGVSATMSASSKQNYLSQQSSAANKAGLDIEPRAHAFVVANENGSWIVFSNTQPKTGRAEVTGTIVEEKSNYSVDGGIYADSVSFSQRGERVSLSELQNSPAEYDKQLVRVTAPYRQIAATSDVGDGLTTQSAMGAFSDSSESLLSSPGQQARIGTINASSNKVGKSNTLNTFSGFSDRQIVISGYGQTRFWTNAKVTLDAAVFQGDAGTQLSIAQLSVEGESVGSIREISTNGGQYAGEVVTVTTDVAGTRTSSQEFLEEAIGCAPDSVTVPSVGCVPIPTDVVAHSGVAYSTGQLDEDSVVPYVAMSNQVQQKVTKPYVGEYRLTGRVVSTSQIDPSLPDGHALLVYEMERVGDSGGTSKARSLAKDVTGRVQEQLKMQPSEWSKKLRVSNTQNTIGNSTGSDDGEQQSSDDGASGGVEIVSVSPESETVALNKTVGIVATVKNNGQKKVTQTLNLQVDGSSQYSKTVDLKPGEKQEVRLPFEATETGKHDIAVNGHNAGQITVQKSLFQRLPLPGTFELLLIGIVFGCLLALYTTFRVVSKLSSRNSARVDGSRRSLILGGSIAAGISIWHFTDLFSSDSDDDDVYDRNDHFPNDDRRSEIIKEDTITAEVLEKRHWDVRAQEGAMIEVWADVQQGPSVDAELVYESDKPETSDYVTCAEGEAIKNWNGSHYYPYKAHNYRIRIKPARPGADVPTVKFRYRVTI